MVLGTAQVSIHTIKYLELYVKHYENIDDAFLFYDNMCNLERMKLWQVDKSKLTPNANLGLSVFNAINKGVDALHISCTKGMPTKLSRSYQRIKVFVPKTKHRECGTDFHLVGEIKKNPQQHE